ncbi:MAG: tripartite tricarboxylate transporter TctB family protein [Deinococcales bacterium]
MSQPNLNPVKRQALLVFYAANFVFSALLLILMPLATKRAPKNQGWWTEPALMPSLALALMALASVYLLIQGMYQLRKFPPDQFVGSRSALLKELFQWLRPLEFFLYFIIYIWLLGLVGYFLSSFIFIAGLCFRVGLRNLRWLGVALLISLALIALFRWGLKVWIPPADLYELFPRPIRIFLMRNF